MSLVGHLVDIIEHEGKLSEECQVCLAAIALAEADQVVEDQEKK